MRMRQSTLAEVQLEKRKDKTSVSPQSERHSNEEHVRSGGKITATTVLKI